MKQSTGVQRVAAVSVVALAASIVLTACGGGSTTGTTAAGGPSGARSVGSGAAGSGSVASGAATGPAPSASASGGGAGSGGVPAPGQSSAGSAGRAAPGARCGSGGAGSVGLTVTGPAAYATGKQPATATVRVVNTSTSSCTLYGFPGVTVVDDEGKSAPLVATRADAEASAAGHVTLKPGQGADAVLQFDDVDTKGSASGLHVCGVQASTVRVVLPDTTAVLAAKVEGGVDGGTLNVCDNSVRVQPFTAAAK